MNKYGRIYSGIRKGKLCPFSFNIETKSTKQFAQRSGMFLFFDSLRDRVTGKAVWRVFRRPVQYTSERTRNTRRTSTVWNSRAERVEWIRGSGQMPPVEWCDPKGWASVWSCTGCPNTAVPLSAHNDPVVLIATRKTADWCGCETRYVTTRPQWSQLDPKEANE